MSYNMRFVVTTDQEIALPAIADALKEIDPSCELAVDSEATRPSADLVFGGDLYAELEINTPGDGLFDEELGELKELLEDAGYGDKARVLGVLDNAKGILAVRVLFGERETEATTAKLDPLWEWLFANREGLLQADGEGYYDSSGLILEVE
jgi:hypothetical protein